MKNTKISAVINTWNEEKNLPGCLDSLNFVDEIIVVDMESTDATVKIAKKYTDKIFSHPQVGYVEPARNFAISKASYSWVLVVDADERIPDSLAKRLKDIVQNDEADYVRLPRQNFVFNTWLKYSRWWPDYNIRFFKKGNVVWQNEIHSIPQTEGRGIDLPAEPEFALTHLHYNTIDEYLTRLIRYTNEQAKELESAGYQFNPLDAVNKPFSEFLSRYFAGEGYKDGFHGLSVSLLQGFSTLIVYLKVWQSQGFSKHDDLAISPNWKKMLRDRGVELKYWLYTIKIHLSANKTEKLLLRIKRKFHL